MLLLTAPIDRQALVRLRLRPRSPWSNNTELHLQHDVPTTHTRRSERRSGSTQQLPRLLTAFIDTHTRSKLLCIGLLSSPARLHQLTRSPTPPGFVLRLLPCQPRNCVVHILEFGNVLRRGADDKHEGPRRLSPSSVLRRVWHNGDIQQQRALDIKL